MLCICAPTLTVRVLSYPPAATEDRDPAAAVVIASGLPLSGAFGLGFGKRVHWFTREKLKEADGADGAGVGRPVERGPKG